MAAPWTNADGLQVKFGNYQVDESNFVNRPRALNTDGLVKQIVFDYDLTKLADGVNSYTSDLNNDGTRDGYNTGDVYLPAYASVLRCVLFVTEASDGGTSIEFGTYTLAGAEIDDDAFITATEGAEANLDTVGARVYGAGARVAATAETASVGAADAYIGLKPAGTFTAGKGRILIEYVDIFADS